MWPQAVRAYRPFDGTDAAVAGPRELEIELGPVGFLRQDSERLLVAPRAVANFGVAAAWEVVAEGSRVVPLGGEGREPRSRVADDELSVKRVLRQGVLQERRGPSIALELGLLLPTVNDEPGTGGRCSAIVSGRVSKATLHANLAAAVTRRHQLESSAGLIAEAPGVGPVHPVGEVLFERDSAGHTAYSGLAGAIWRVRQTLALDIAARRARADHDSALELRGGLTWSTRLRHG